MDQLRLDLRSALLQLRQRPLTALLSIGVLGLGIGLVTSQFALLHGVIYRGLPFPGADRLIHLERNHLERGDYNAEVPIHDLEAYARGNTTLEGLAGFTVGTINVSDGIRPRRFDGCFASANLLEVLRVSPLLGRAFPEGSDEKGADPVLLLSYDVWKNYYGGDEDVIGRSVNINSLPGTIIGVMPEGFSFPVQQQVWMPHRVYADDLEPGEGTTFEVVARMKRGVELEAVEAELSGVASQLARAFPESHEGMRVVDAKPFVREYIGTEPMALLHLLFVLGLLILAVACANVANITLARVSARRREMAIRAALGASRQRLISQMLIETMVIAAGGLILGLVFTQAFLEVMWRELKTTELPFWVHVEVDFWVAACAFLTMIGAGLLAGFYPARQASRIELSDLLKDAARGSSVHQVAFSRVLVVAQIAVSSTVFFMALLMMKAQWEANRMEWPFAPGEVFSARMGLFEGDYPEAADRERFMRELLRTTREDPRVESAALGSRYRFGTAFTARFGLSGETYAEDSNPYPYTRYEPVSEGYFAALGVPLLRGREFSPRDTSEAPRVVIINNRFAERYFGDRDPLGQRLFFPENADSGGEGIWREIIGIVPDLHMAMHSDWEHDHGQGVYVPITDEPPRFFTLLGMGTPPLSGLASVFRERVQALDPNLPLYEMETVETSIAEANKVLNFFLWVFLAFGGAAGFLSATGVFGVVSLGVNQRKTEIGIRMALGATRRRILRWVYGTAWGPWVLGIGLGLGVGEALASLLWVQVFNTGGAQLYDHLIVAVLISGIVVLAILVPSIRAARVSPQEALRTE